MKVIRINAKNVIFIIFAILSTSVRVVYLGYETASSLAIRYSNSTPASANFKEDSFVDSNCLASICSELGVDCLECHYDPDCIYGDDYTVTCTVPEHIQCMGKRSFIKPFICRYCYQTEVWEHDCHQKYSCNTVASPQQYYRSNCTIKSNVTCLGRRKFLKNLPCNWTNGYKWSTALLLSITLGGFGADRFYLGHWQEGIGKLFSFGGLGVWTLIDVMLISMRYLGPADGSLYI